jgi:hypothetical protein
MGKAFDPACLDLVRYFYPDLLAERQSALAQIIQDTIGDFSVTCEKCGAPITTGMMAMICPHAEKCEFWPEDESSQEFVKQLRAQHPLSVPSEKP